MTRASTSERRGGIGAGALADHRGDARAEARSLDDPLEIVHVVAAEAVLVPVGEERAAEPVARADRVDDGRPAARGMSTAWPAVTIVTPIRAAGDETDRAGTQQ